MTDDLWDAYAPIRAALTHAWPPEATSEPPEYPWKLDRHTYEAPGMAAWRATLHGGTTVAQDDDLDLRDVRRDVGTAARPTTRPRRAWTSLLRRLPTRRRPQ